MNVYDFSVKSVEGEEISLSNYRGKILLILNSATDCGYTQQYEALQRIYEAYHGVGLEILDFPCNQFGNEAPGSLAEILTFRQEKYGVTFPLFEKVEVNGEHESPLFRYLKAQKRGRNGHDIPWNFTKFLVNPIGEVMARYPAATSLERVKDQIDAMCKIYR